LGSASLTAAQMSTVWDDYYRLQLDSIDKEIKGLDELGIPYEKLHIYREQAIADLQAQNEELRKQVNENAWNQQPWMNPPKTLWAPGEDFTGSMKDLAENSGQAMYQAFDDTFFKLMDHQFVHIRDFFKSIVDDMTQYLEKAFAETLSRIMTKYMYDFAMSLGGLFGGGGGGSPLGDFFGGGPTYAATGGIFDKPTLAVIGEAGPEAVVPLSRMDNQSFWNDNGGDLARLGINLENITNRSQININENNAAPIVIHMNIQTPDPSSFKASSEQIMSKLNVALDQARRRNS
jgi:hypothetical protein